MESRPLDGLLVLDFSQFLAGPSCALRLADLGARVIKIERPDGGEAGRRLAIADLFLDGDSVLFHTINRNKLSFAANLKDPNDAARVRALIARADVLIQNFRPGVIERLGFGYDHAAAINPRLVYATVTGYGASGPWRDLPGQDLLAQARSGLPFLNGNADQPPLPFGLAVVDIVAGAHLTQGILACLVRRGITGRGGLVEVSLIESALDLQFEVFTAYLNDNERLPQRSAINNAHAYLGAPYGIYATADGYLALAMGSVTQLGELLECEALLAYTDPATWFSARDEIKSVIASHLATQSTACWIERLEAADYWCAEVLDWNRLTAHPAFAALQMVQQVTRSNGKALATTRCPIRIDGSLLTSPTGAPHIGEHTAMICAEYGLE